MQEKEIDFAEPSCNYAGMLTWDDYCLTLAIARAGTLTGAARRLGVNETTVARRLAAAERRAGTTLLARKGGRLEPTADGKSVIAAAEAMERAAAGAGTQPPTALVRVSAVAFVVDRLVAPELPDFIERNPGITLELVPSNETASLAGREADIALRLAQPERGRLVARRIGSLSLHLAAKAGHMPRRYLAYERDLDDLPESAAVAALFDGPPAARINSTAGLAAAAAAGLGAAMLPEAVIREDSRLAIVDKSVAVSRPLWLVVHEDLQHRPAIRAVVDWLADMLSRKLHGDGG